MRYPSCTEAIGVVELPPGFPRSDQARSLFPAGRETRPPVIKWLHAYWLVVLVSVVLAVTINQLVFFFLYGRQNKSDERRRREQIVRSVLSDLRAHCENLQPALLNPVVDSDRWQEANVEFQTRARARETIQALGDHYDGFMFAVATEARAIVEQRRHQDPASTIENVADTLIAYAPFVKAFGDAQAARRFESMARRSYDYAKTLRPGTPARKNSSQ